MGRTRRPEGEPTRAQLPISDPDLVELIEGIRDVRRTIDADLTTAAAAVDADRLDVAHDILDGTLADVAAFRRTAIARLDAEEADPVSAATIPALAIPAQGRPRRLQSRRARALVAIPTIPLVGALAMGAAAALGDLGAPTPRAPAATHAVTKPIAHPSATPTSASTTLARLERVVSNHPQSSRVLAVADTLHKQLTHIITTASHNPSKLDAVSQLLSTEQQVLKNNHAPAASIALAASQQVSTLLNQTSVPVLSLKSPTAPPSSQVSTAPKKSHHATKKSSKHHKRSSHRKRKTATTTPLPTPSTTNFGNGVVGVLP